jgi:hypothetical protein
LKDIVSGINILMKKNWNGREVKHD